MQNRALTFARRAWLIGCLSAGTIGGLFFGFAAGGVLGAVACGIGCAFVGLMLGSSIVWLVELLAV